MFCLSTDSIVLTQQQGTCIVKPHSSLSSGLSKQWTTVCVFTLDDIKVEEHTPPASNNGYARILDGLGPQRNTSYKVDNLVQTLGKHPFAFVVD